MLLIQEDVAPKRSNLRTMGWPFILKSDGISENGSELKVPVNLGLKKLKVSPERRDKKGVSVPGSYRDKRISKCVYLVSI